MRRSTRLGLAAVVGLLVLGGAYTLYWWIVAGQIEDHLLAWQQSERAQKIDASWQTLRVVGFPFHFRIALSSAALRDRALTPALEIRLAELTGSARPWDFADWRFDAPRGLAADLAAAGSRPPVKLAAQTAEGTVSLGSEGATSMWLNFHDASAEAGDRVPIKAAQAWIGLPANPPRTHTEPLLELALDLRQMQLSAPPPSFSNVIDDLAFGVTVKGAVPDGPLVQAIAAWRDAGGAIELDHLQLNWGGLGATATGTMALDQDLQPIGAFSVGIEGFGAIVSALVEAGRLDTEEAALAQIALSALAKRGPDGKPQIATSFTIQDGKMYLGPAKLGAAPRIVWR
jgi:hypothetical protein